MIRYLAVLVLILCASSFGISNDEVLSIAEKDSSNSWWSFADKKVNFTNDVVADDNNSNLESSVEYKDWCMQDAEQLVALADKYSGKSYSGIDQNAVDLVISSSYYIYDEEHNKKSKIYCNGIISGTKGWALDRSVISFINWASKHLSN